VIARVWRGIAITDKAEAYLDHLQQEVFPQLHHIAGYRGASVLRRDLAEGVEFTVQTLWESMEAIRNFAGEAVETAVVAPAAQPLFHRFDATVTHHAIVLHSER
jgi:heme-degrading monooxygenase HmoA